MKKNKKGFTLAELLIVVAIIAVLVAIAIPVFSKQLESAREGTDAANIRSENAQVMTDVLMNNNNSFEGAHPVPFKQMTGSWQNTDIESGLQALAKTAATSDETNVIVTGNPTKGGSATFSYVPATTTTAASVTIAIG